MATIHVNRGGTTLGTFSEEDVREGLRTGRLQPTDLGWREGMASWQPLSQFSEFADVQPSPAAPPPPPTPPPVTSMVTTPPAASGATSSATSAAPRSGLPWDERQTRGLFAAFLDTLKFVLSKPAEAFTAMKREGGMAEPLLYALIGGSLGYIVYLLFMLFMPSLAFMGDRHNAFAGAFGAGIGIMFAIIFIPIALTLGLFIWSGVLHVCLMLVGGAKQSFETTFRVVCVAIGSTYPLVIVPFCGGMVASVWGIVLQCIGIARAHETDTGRAVLAVFLPLILCCVAGALILFVFGGIGALMQNSH